MFDPSDIISLDGQDRRDVIWNFAPALFNEGYSANQALQLFKEAGFGINRKEFLDIYSQVGGYEQDTQKIKYLGYDDIPGDEVFAPSRTPQSERYRYIVEYEGYDIFKRTGVKDFWAIDSDIPLSRNDAAAAAQGAIEGEYPITIYSVNVVRSYIDEDL